MTAPLSTPVSTSTARRVYVHVGLPKTGTTYLQTTMWHNRASLRRQGLLYPGGQRLDHYKAFQQVRGGAKGRGDGMWDVLAGELAGHDGTGLVSHEFFSMATPAQAQRVVADLAPAEVHVILTLRAYPLQFPAVWQEALKMGYDGSFDAFMEDAFADRLKGAWGWASQDIPAVLERWATAVPVERTHLITVPPPDAPRDLLWRRWCETLGIDDTDFSWDVGYPNESLGAQQAALLRRLKPHLSGELLDGPTRHRWVRRYFGHEVLVPQAGDRFTPRAEHIDELHRRCELAVGALTDAGYDVAGDLDDLLVRRPASSVHPDDVTTEEMLDVAVHAIEQMIRDVRELSLERDTWKARAVAGPGGVTGLARKAVRKTRKARKARERRGDGADD